MVIAAQCGNHGFFRLLLVVVPFALIAAYVGVVRVVTRGHHGSRVPLAAVYVLGLALGVGGAILTVDDDRLWFPPFVLAGVGVGFLIGTVTVPKAPGRLAVMSGLGVAAAFPGSVVLFFLLVGAMGDCPFS